MEHNKYFRIIYYAMIIVLLLASCTKEDNNFIGIQNELSASQLKTNLLKAKDNSNLITQINEIENLDQITFEDGTTVAINQSEIDHIDRDSINWLATFHFSDGSNATASMLGFLNITNDMIQLNPYSKSPLTALASFTMPVKGMFKVIVHGKGQNGIPIEKDFSSFDFGHELPILGLYQSYDNKVEFIFTSQKGAVRKSTTLTITTGAVDSQTAIKINKNTMPPVYNGLYFVADLRLAFDQTGEIRWIYTGDATLLFHKLNNGNLSISSASVNSFYEVTMMGQIIKKYDVPNGIHHEIKEIPNGNFLVGSNSGNGTSIEDMVVEISRTSGAVVRSWDFNKILDPTRLNLPLASTQDWLHLNCIYYDDTDNTIIISSRHQSAVVKLDYATSEIKWILGDHTNWNPSLAHHLLNPVDSLGNSVDVSKSDFWPYGQHSPLLLPNGHILLYDDGNYRGYFENPNAPAASYTRAVEYAIDEQAQTISLVWKFDNNKSIFTAATGYIDFLKQTNTRMIAYMFGSVNTPKIIELDGNNNIVFDANVNTGVNFYRALKVELYEGIF